MLLVPFLRIHDKIVVLLGGFKLDNKKRFKAKIGEKDFTLIGTASEEHMTAVTKILNDELNKIKSQNNRISDEDAAILLAFNAISDQLDKQLELDEIRKKDLDK